MGPWITVDDDADEVRTRIAAMLKASPVAGAEEWAIHDYEDFGGVKIAEYARIERVVEVAAFLRSRGRLGGAWCWSMSAAR
jgi:antirestriction protein